jgi:Ca-activated chloride channel family protein
MKRLTVPQTHWTIVLIFTAVIAALLFPGWAQLSWAQRQRLPSPPRSSVTQASLITQGSLVSLEAEGRLREFCPLKHTDVKIEVSGFLARATVTQHFVNPSAEKIEAVYTFPLPRNAAVDNMTMLVGERFVRAEIKRREEAQAIYAAARSGGKVAGLLDQERPNIFTQSVANILPGEQVKVTISYVELLKYDAGSYEVVFPMVVGPRYIAGSPLGKQGGGFAHDTDRVPDASRITPPVTPPGTRAGHDISIEIALDAGLPIEGLQSPTHEIDVERTASNQARIRLREKATLPNKDFILRYDVAGRKIQDALLTHRDGRGGFFTLILQPPDRVTTADVTPKELVFVLDTSGSMSGFPIEKAKETMRLALDGLYPQDTFNLITFAGDTHILFPRPVPASKENLRKAQMFLESRSGSGGTEMMKAIRAALDSSDSQQHVRIVCFMTDGYVGNDMEIIAEVQKHPNARVFAFGIGSAVNRFLLDKVAEHGRGEVEYVGLQDDGSAAARRFHERIRNPLLTDISIDWGRLPLTDIYPKRIPDLFSAKPVVLSGRYTESSTGVIRLRGKTAGGEMIREIRMTLPASELHHDVVATLWARTHVEDLMGQDYNRIQQGNARKEVREAITKIGLDYRLMTHFTSFVAVEEMVTTDGGQPRRIDVPVEMPDGVSYEGVFGGRETDYRALNAPASIAPRQGLMREFSMAKRHYSGVFGEPPADTSVNAEPIKLHPAIAALVDRLKQKKAATAEEAKFVRNGRAEVQVWLSDTTPTILDEIKKLGFEIVLQPKTGKLIIGRVPIEKLALLVEMKSVRYLAPQIL